MLHPVVVGAVLVLLMNDHILKDRWPGVLTGKLSDVAGLVFFPLLLVAVAEMCRSWMRLPPPSRRFVAICVALTGLVFAAGELVPVVDGALELAWGWVRSPVDALAGRSVRGVVMVADPTDLLTLPALWIGWTIGSSRAPLRERPARPHGLSGILVVTGSSASGLAASTFRGLFEPGREKRGAKSSENSVRAIFGSFTQTPRVPPD